MANIILSMSTLQRSVPLTKKFQTLCDKAYNLAMTSDMSMYLCALVLSNSKIVSQGVNSHSRQRVHGYNTPSMHSEMAAIAKLTVGKQRNHFFNTRALRGTGSQLKRSVAIPSYRLSDIRDRNHRLLRPQCQKGEQYYSQQGTWRP